VVDGSGLFHGRPSGALADEIAPSGAEKGGKSRIAFLVLIHLIDQIDGGIKPTYVEEAPGATHEAINILA
jgi:hypothetical protein